MKFKKEFRLLTLGWSDGNSFVPVNYCLLSAAEDKNLLCGAKSFDGRSVAGRCRSQSRRKATDVMLELIATAHAAGLSAGYVLFSWFSSPKTIISLRNDLHKDTIAMIKKGKTKYLYEGERLNIKQIYSRNRKKRGQSKYLLFVAKRRNEDDKTICKLFSCLMDELKDITFSQSMQIILVALLDTVIEFFHITKAQLEEFTSSFIGHLPKYMQDELSGVQSAA